MGGSRTHDDGQTDRQTDTLPPSGQAIGEVRWAFLFDRSWTAFVAASSAIMKPARWADGQKPTQTRSATRVAR